MIEDEPSWNEAVSFSSFASIFMAVAILSAYQGRAIG